MTVSSKRAEYRAIWCLVLSIVFFVGALLTGLWSGFFAVYATSWMALGAALIWFVLCVQFHQRSLAEQEKLDMTQLAKAKEGSTIFQATDERGGMLAVAKRRLQVLEKWFIPIFSAIIACYQLGIGFYLLSTLSRGIETDVQQPLLVAILMTIIAFISFSMSRYIIGMSAEAQWKPLRAGGSFLLGVAVLCFGLAVALALAQFKTFIVLDIINWVIPILLAVLGAETALNVVLDIYRPRLKGQYPRSAFDSRLLGLISEPGGILRTAAGAIDYQFGFKVSETWFYKLAVEKALVPLALFAIAVIYLLSCIVVVDPNEETIIEHFGNPLKETGEKRLVGPGLTLKWPWPIDKVYKYPTKNISEITIGFIAKSETGGEGYGPLLWGKTHYEQEDKLLVASESQQTGSEAVPVSLVMAAVPIQYRVKDLYAFLYNYGERKEREGAKVYKVYEAEELLKSICYQELTNFAASAKIEVGGGAGTSESLLGAGRAEAKRVLTERIQKAADEKGLGIEVLFVGLQGIHPPPEVAADYQKVVAAVQTKQAAILAAEAQRNQTLSSLSGSVAEANQLYLLAAQYQKAKDENQLERADELGLKLDKAFSEAKGDIFAALRGAQSYSFEKATLARATGERFSGQLKAYRAAEEIYLHEQTLTALEESLEGVRKYVVAADANDRRVFIVDVTEKLTPSLYDLSGFKESQQK